jgi:hypothetical protein
MMNNMPNRPLSYMLRLYLNNAFTMLEVLIRPYHIKEPAISLILYEIVVTTSHIQEIVY